MIKIYETRIASVNKNTHKELKVSFIIKPEDYTIEQEDLFYDLKNNWTLWAFIFQWTEFTENTWKSDQEIKNKLLQDLAFFMTKYAEKELCEIENLKQDLYKKYWVESRTELTIEQLKKEVDSYKAWLMYEF